MVFLSLSEIVANPPREVEQQMVPLPVWQKRRLARLYDIVTTSLRLTRNEAWNGPLHLVLFFSRIGNNPQKVSFLYNRPGNEAALKSKPHLMTRETHPFRPRRRRQHSPTLARAARKRRRQGAAVRHDHHLDSDDDDISSTSTLLQPFSPKECKESDAR
jgi:hypothetical protein